MTPSPEIAAAFETWKLAELASHYASPCPDDVMTRLVDIAWEAFDALQATPAASADDMLLKLFPIVLREMEPGLGDAPLRPSASRVYDYPEAFYDRLRADLASVSAAVRDAMESPHRSHTA